MTPMPHLGSAADHADTAHGGRSARGQSGLGQPSLGQPGLGQNGRDILARTVALDVIPRLVSMPWITTHQDAPLTPVHPHAVDPGQIELLVRLCLEAEGHGAATFIAQAHLDGMPARQLYLGLLTPAARRLGELWDNDDCSFTDVTIGVMRLQNAQRALSHDIVGDRQLRLDAPRILLMPVPGDQHTFGLSLVMDFFRRAGWDSWLGVVASDEAAIDFIRRERAEMVGLSFACEDRIDSAAMLIANFRLIAPNQSLKIIVGGPAFVADPHLAARIGADGTALDGHQAVMLAHDLLLHTDERP